MGARFDDRHQRYADLGARAQISLSGVLTNAGTVNFTGTVNLIVFNNNGSLRRWDSTTTCRRLCFFAFKTQLINGN